MNRINAITFDFQSTVENTIIIIIIITTMQQQGPTPFVCVQRRQWASSQVCDPWLLCARAAQWRWSWPPTQMSHNAVLIDSSDSQCTPTQLRQRSAQKQNTNHNSTQYNTTAC